MGETTGIQWCDATFNTWWGCTKISIGCDSCYAETWAKRIGFANIWGVDAQRRTFGESHWNEPLKWNRKAEEDGKRLRVFCSSMADVFDNHPICERERRKLWGLIKATPRLDYLLLTKRIGNAKSMLPADWGNGYPNVWLGISVVNQEEADRDIPKLLATPAAIRFLSCEPLLAPIDLDPFAKGSCTTCGGAGELAASGPTTTFPEDDDGIVRCDDCRGTGADDDNPGLDWIIVGGESGSGARSMVLGWAKDIVRQCQAAQISVFVKQLGARPTNREGLRHPISDAKGGILEEFPAELRARQWPR